MNECEMLELLREVREQAYLAFLKEKAEAGDAAAEIKHEYLSYIYDGTRLTGQILSVADRVNGGAEVRTENMPDAFLVFSTYLKHTERTAEFLRKALDILVKKLLGRGPLPTGEAFTSEVAAEIAGQFAAKAAAEAKEPEEKTTGGK